MNANIDWHRVYATFEWIFFLFFPAKHTIVHPASFQLTYVCERLVPMLRRLQNIKMLMKSGRPVRIITATTETAYDRLKDFYSSLIPITLKFEHSSWKITTNPSTTWLSYSIERWNWREIQITWSAWRKTEGSWCSYSLCMTKRDLDYIGKIEKWMGNDKWHQHAALTICGEPPPSFIHATADFRISHGKYYFNS